MEALPELDIQEDLEELDDEVVEEVVKEVSVAQPEDIFAGKPTNGKQAPRNQRNGRCPRNKRRTWIASGSRRWSPRPRSSA